VIDAGTSEIINHKSKATASFGLEFNHQISPSPGEPRTRIKMRHQTPQVYLPNGM